ncbi:unnamed protein product [Closterium sp. Naga37s-1]|nr:unnamed protein product [Closterium sp. Naga37s-1]
MLSTLDLGNNRLSGKVPPALLQGWPHQSTSSSHPPPSGPINQLLRPIPHPQAPSINFFVPSPTLRPHQSTSSSHPPPSGPINQLLRPIPHPQAPSINFFVPSPTPQAPSINFFIPSPTPQAPSINFFIPSPTPQAPSINFFVPSPTLRPHQSTSSSHPPPSGPINQLLRPIPHPQAPPSILPGRAGPHPLNLACPIPHFQAEQALKFLSLASNALSSLSPARPPHSPPPPPPPHPRLLPGQAGPHHPQPRLQRPLRSADPTLPLLRRLPSGSLPLLQPPLRSHPRYNRIL